MDPFRSLTVLSLEQATTLPFMTLRLVEEGVRVIRLESPPYGDPNRWVGPEVLPATAGEPGFETGMNAYFMPNNLGKESITLNLATAEGRAVLHRLVDALPVDVFATNQRWRSYEKLGIDYATLSGIKPDLIWVGITGFGPDHDEAAYDPVLQARSGLMDLTGEPDGDPQVLGLPVVDLIAGEHGYGQVMKALYRRALTGRGSRIDVPMFQSAVSWMVSPILLAGTFGLHVKRHGNTHRFFAPVSVFPTIDGHLYLSVGNDRQWQAITELPGFRALARPEYEKNAGRIAAVEELNAAITAVTRTMTSDELTGALRELGVPVSPVNAVRDVCVDPIIQSNMVRAHDPRTGTEITIPGPAVASDFLLENGMTLGFPPRLGEHNEAILGSMGYDVADLGARGVI